MIESHFPSDDIDAQIEHQVDSGKFSYDQARQMVTGVKESSTTVDQATDERTAARNLAHQENTQIYHLTGVPTSEQRAEAQAAMQGEAYQATQEAATQAFEVSIGDPTVANAIRAARASRQAQAQTLASSTRTQL